MSHNAQSLEPNCRVTGLARYFFDVALEDATTTHIPAGSLRPAHAEVVLVEESDGVRPEAVDGHKIERALFEEGRLQRDRAGRAVTNGVAQLPFLLGSGFEQGRDCFRCAVG